MATALPPSPLPPNLSATGRAVLGRRREPGRGWAALFAFAVHLGFFALIVFGVSWQVKVPTPLSAELWESLPMRNVAQSVPPPTPEPVKAEPPPPPVPTKPATPSKSDIALKAKQLQDEKRQRELDEKAAAETKKREELKRADDKRRLDDDKQRKLDAAKAKADADKAKAEADRLRAEQDAREAAVRAARDKALADYTGKIAALIRSRANIPDSVTGQPEIQVRVRLLTSGTVFEANVSKPSGNRAFDEAVERAINGIRQWPVPENPEILGRQRELLLNIKHER